MKILGKNFKKQMRENKSLTLKLFPKTKKTKNSSYDSGENEALFVKIKAWVLELIPYTSSVLKWPNYSF